VSEESSAFLEMETLQAQVIGLSPLVAEHFAENSPFSD
jgi:hypothetical protein